MCECVLMVKKAGLRLCDPAPWLHLAAGASSGNLETHFTIPIQGDVIHRVDVVLGVPPSWPPAQPLLPNSHQPMQNWADGGTTKIKVNPKNPGLRAENHPVYKTFCSSRIRFRRKEELDQQPRTGCWVDRRRGR